MSDSFTGATGTWTPALIEGYEAQAEAKNIEHRIPAAAASSYTLRPAAMRNGRMRALFVTASDAQGLFADLRAAATIAFTSTSQTYTAMTFVLAPGGRAQIGLSRSRKLWIVEFDWQEVVP